MLGALLKRVFRDAGSTVAVGLMATAVFVQITHPSHEAVGYCAIGGTFAGGAALFLLHRLIFRPQH